VIAAERATVVPAAARTRVDEATVRTLLESVHDPEIPNISIVDLGIVERVDVTPQAIEVELLPTFVGCPALEVIRASVIEALMPLGREALVSFTWRVPWTSDRISDRGRARLAASGFAPPAEPADVRCPYCQSAKVAMDSAFGPTQCRSLFYCRDCRQPFEAFKPI
jgi:ring-1,2-phenylacetyl-CoA epoxidase subunit PaaD